MLSFFYTVTTIFGRYGPFDCA